MKRTVALAALLGAAAPLGQAAAQQCTPQAVSIGYTQPNNVAISDENADRWPTDATIRLGYGGAWCPEAAQFTLEKIDDGTPVPAQVRFVTPFTLVENSPPALTLVDVDPIDALEPRTDYRLVVRPPNPSIPLFAEYTLEFRTANRTVGPLPVNDFEGVRGVALAGNRCSENGPFAALDDTNPACLVSTRLRLNIAYQPIDRGDVSYIIYRNSTTPLDEGGQPIIAEADNTRIPLMIQSGARDTLGTGVPPRQAQVEVLYYPIPRRDCFSVVMLDEWGRERGDTAAVACVDLLPLAPCPDGCDPMQMGSCMFGFPDPNPFETNDPVPGQMCPNIGLNGGPADREIPPVGEEPGAGGAGGGGDAGVGGPDGGGSNGGGGGGGGCSATPGAPGGAAWLALLALVGLRRRRDRQG
ncbi:MAG: hypothetical protein H6702_10800 [Myxococcales bacterium]|nr:hypothetical protein [Myxococcales bacterium]